MSFHKSHQLQRSWSCASSWNESLLNNCWRSSWSCSWSFKTIWDHLGSSEVKLDDLRSYEELSVPSLISLILNFIRFHLDFILVNFTRSLIWWPFNVIKFDLLLTEIWPWLRLISKTTNEIQELEMLQSIQAEQHLSRWRRSDKMFILIVLCNNSIFENASSVSLTLLRFKYLILNSPLQITI